MLVYMHVNVCTVIVENDNAQGGHKIFKGTGANARTPKKNPIYIYIYIYIYMII